MQQLRSSEISELIKQKIEHFEAKPEARRIMSYSDNFAFKRRDAWTH